MSHCPPTGRHVTLTRTQQEVYVPYTSLALRYKLEVTDPYLIDSEIFKMVRRPVDPADTSAVVDTFVSVCTPGDLETLDIGAPPVEDPTAHFRVAVVYLTFDSETDAETAWVDIQAAVTQLVAALDAGECLGTGESVFIGT